jgi:hypothetical protein
MVCEITGLILKTCGLGDRAAAAAAGCGAAVATSIGAARGARAGRFFGGAVVINLVVRTAAFLRGLRAFLAAFFWRI